MPLGNILNTVPSPLLSPPLEAVPLTISAVKDAAKAISPTVIMAASISLGDGGSGVGKTVANNRKATAMTADDAKARRAHT